MSRVSPRIILTATLDDVLSYMADQWGYSAEDAEKDWNDYYAKDYTNENGNVN